MTEKPRDWDRELAEIDKVIARSPDVPPAGSPAAPAGRPAIAPGGAPRAPAPAAVPSRRGRAAAWTFALMAAALAVGLQFWPYLRTCGFGLLGYTGVVGLLILVSIWASLSSWRHRVGVAHLLSLMSLLWGLALAAMIILPRIGYARTALTWDC